MKRAYIVAGAESSGNRMLASLLIAAGCEGGTTFDHPLMSGLPTDEDPVVLVRSYPHGNEWPDLGEMFRALRDRGYMVRVLIAARDPHCAIRSAVERRHHPQELAWANYQRAYMDIFRQLAAVNVWYVLVPYESLVIRPVEAAHELLSLLELPSVEVPIDDRNGAHYA